MSETQTAAAPATTTEPEGIRSRRAIMMKQLLPSQEWIIQNVVPLGKGARATVGRIFGIVQDYETKWNNIPGQDMPVESITLKGAIQYESYLTGEVGEGSSVYLPMAYAEKVRTVFKSGERTDEAGEVTGNDIRVVEIDCDIGVEATGKIIPYEWVVIAFKEGEAMAVLKNLRNSRRRPENVLSFADKVIPAVPRAPEPTLALAAPTALEGGEDTASGSEGGEDTASGSEGADSLAGGEADDKAAGKGKGKA